MPVIDLDDFDPAFCEGAKYCCFWEKGVHVHFDYYILSIQIGYGNYCANRDYNRNYDEYPSHCYDAEIAIWHHEIRNLISFEGESYDTIAGWVLGSTIVEIIPLIKGMRRKTEKKTMQEIANIISSKGRN